MARSRVVLGVLMLVAVLFVGQEKIFADEVIFTEDFESGWGDWYADNGVWEVGIALGGPGSAYGGMQCAGTVLNGNYPAYTDSRLIYPVPFLPGLQLPEVISDEELHLRFWHWFSYSSYDYGYVQIQVQDGSEWETVPSAIVISGSYTQWTLRDIDLTPYAGKIVKIGFYHTANRDSHGHASESSGWYIDDIEIVKKVPCLNIPEDFEEGWGDWVADNCIWEVGVPTGGPGGAHGGTQCAATKLSGNYPGYRDSKLISPSIWLPEVIGDEKLHLRFWHWFSYSSYDSGCVQISLQEEVTGDWSDWEIVSGNINISSAVWSPMDIDLTSYAGQKARIAFYHTANRNSHGHASESSGWYIDDVEIVRKIPRLTGDFEYGWDDWSADRGVWQVGTPTSGPGSCHGGDQCAGTKLSGNYPGYTDSRLISAPIWLPTQCSKVIYISYRQWWSYSSYDSGYVQISVQDEVTGDWSDWETLPGTTVAGSSPVWTPRYVDLTSYAGQKARIAFYHTANRNSHGHASESSGWYIDDIEFIGITPTMNNVFFTRYIPPPCTSLITASASEPCNGNLIYNWDAPDGGDIMGTGAEVEFDPPGTRFEPYTVRVSVTSDLTHISSFVKTIKIYTEVAYDYDEDGDIDGSDLAKFAADPDDLARFAEEFGMVACQ